MMQFTSMISTNTNSCYGYLKTIEEYNYETINLARNKMKQILHRYQNINTFNQKRKYCSV